MVIVVVRDQRVGHFWRKLDSSALERVWRWSYEYLHGPHITLDEGRELGVVA